MSGARRKVEEWDSKDNEVIQFTSNIFYDLYYYHIKAKEGPIK